MLPSPSRQALNVIALTGALKVCRIYQTIKNSPWRVHEVTLWLTVPFVKVHARLGCAQAQESLLDSVRSFLGACYLLLIL